VVTTQVFRLKAEGSKLSRKARIEPFKTFSEFCIITHDLPLKAFSLQSIYLSSYFTRIIPQIVHTERRVFG
jgi:hypothetical protein